MSVYHRIADISVMRSDVLVRLAQRLPAYNGAVAARMAAERRQQPATGRTGRTGRVTQAPRYERASPMANNGRMADQAPPATAESLAALNAQLGAKWFNHVTVGGDG